ncbi:MAG: glycosyltransferase family 2 protein [Bacteroidales bacterium]|nr:glycosyltransferase family 2 protein [Bacteroidales bacterium]
MISVVILNFNNLHYTIKCIRSIIQYTKEINYEIIVVDNASTHDNTDAIKEMFPEVILVKNDKNRGFSAGCNDGINHAKGDYILLLNNDTELLNNAISIVHSFLEENKNVGIATCRIENSDGSPQHNCQPFPFKWKFWFEKSRIHKLLSPKMRSQILWGPYFNYTEVAFPDWVWGTFFMFHRSLLNVFPQKKLTETFWMYIEDLEWCWIVRKQGLEVAFVPDARIVHYGGGSKHTEQAKEQITKNMKIFRKMYM